MYLNDDFKGAETTFILKERTKVMPVQGSALLFFHGNSHLSPLHEGPSPTSGRKYVLRSDIMYKLNE